MSSDSLNPPGPPSSCDSMPTPKLTRHNGSPFDEDGLLWCPLTTTCAPVGPEDREARQLAGAALRAYFALPLRGAPLPIKKCGVDDTWASRLQTDLFEILAGDDALDRMRRFSAEKWLGDVVEREGTADQKLRWAEIVAGLSVLDGVDVAGQDDALRGLPSDVGMVAPQPLQEVEVYRSLDEMDVMAGAGVDADAADDGEEEAEDSEMK